MDDRRAALILATLGLAGAVARFALAPTSRADAAPGDVRLGPATQQPARPASPPPRANPRLGAGRQAPQDSALRQTTLEAVRLSRPLQPGERIDLDIADVTEVTRLPRVGPALAQRIVAWRTQHGPFGGFVKLDSVPGVGAKLIDAIRPYVMFSGTVPPP